MTEEHTLEVLERYEAKVAELLQRYPVYGDMDVLGKLLPKLRAAHSKGLTDEVQRGIGFTQGVLWARRHYELRDVSWHNKPKVLQFPTEKGGQL